MVALAAGGIALTSIYAIGSASTKHFREQQRVANTQTSLRMAMDQLKRDFQRAGFLSSPNANLQQESCGTPAPALGFAQAVVGYVNNDATTKLIADPANVNAAATVDEIVLTGNYSTTGEYPGITVTGTNAFTVSRNSQGFRRDFNDWATNGYDEANFENVFRVNRMVRLHARNETYHFSRIESVDGALAQPLIELTTAISGNCSPTGGWVAPVNTIRYRVEAPPADDEAARIALTPTDTIALLKRTELNWNRTAVLLDAAGLPVDDRTLLDYVVAFNVRFRAAPANVVNWTLLDGNAAADVITNRPHELRSVIIDLAARTPEQDPRLFPIGDPLLLRTFKMNPAANVPGAARVRAAHAEVLLSNMAFKGY